MTSVDLPRPDVPAPIAVVRDFVNTTDHETGTDELTTKAELSRYLLREGLLPRASRATDDDLALALRLRAGLRRALELNHDGSVDALPSLAEALRELPIGLDWAGNGPTLRVTASGVRGALGKGRAGRPGGGLGRDLVAAEDLRVRRLRVGLLRQLEEPLEELVRVRLRQQGQDAQLPREAAGESLSGPTAGGQWMRCSQSLGTLPDGPGVGWSAGRLVGSASRGPSADDWSTKSQYQSSPGSKLCM